jgi:hypothetical protein
VQTSFLIMGHSRQDGVHGGCGKHPLASLCITSAAHYRAVPEMGYDTTNDMSPWSEAAPLGSTGPSVADASGIGHCQAMHQAPSFSVKQCAVLKCVNTSTVTHESNERCGTS